MGAWRSLARTFTYLRDSVSEGWVSMRGDGDAELPNDLADRRRLEVDLPGALSLAEMGRAVAIVKIDVDGFEEFIGRHGPLAGDHVLDAVVDMIRAHVRDGDVIYHTGDEQFCVLLPGTTEEEARSVSERLRVAVESAGRVTISVGVALTHRGPPVDALRHADDALSEAKGGGGNRVVVVLGPDGPGLLLS